MQLEINPFKVVVVKGIIEVDLKGFSVCESGAA